MSTPSITVRALQDLIQQGKKPYLVDVREAHELHSLPFRGAPAKHIPLGQLPQQLDALPKDVTLYMLCRSGGRSEMAQKYLLQQGFQAINITGGTLAWYRDVEGINPPA